MLFSVGHATAYGGANFDQREGCWKPSGTAESEDFVLKVDGADTAAAPNGLHAGSDWLAAVTAGCVSCVNSSLLLNGIQTRFDCTQCPQASTLVVTNLNRKSGWCNANQGSCTHTSTSYKQCSSCVKTLHPTAQAHTQHGSCTTCPEGSVLKPYSWLERALLPDGTKFYPVTLGIGTCKSDSNNRALGHSVQTATGIYDYGAPWCYPLAVWDPDKLVCAKITTVANRVEVNGALYLVECEVRKYMHRYKCYADANKCRTGEDGPKCDSTGTSCGSAMYRGDSMKEVACTGLYTEQLYGYRGQSIGCDNIPANIQQHVGCSGSGVTCAMRALCSRIAAIE